MDHYENACEKFEELDTKKEKVNLDEFEDFMRKVEEVNKMVNALTSDDKTKAEEATKNADIWLEKQEKPKSSKKEMREEILNDPTQKHKKIDKTVINDKAFKDPKDSKPREENLDSLTSESMSQEAFMKTVEADANKRKEDRLKRIKESDAIKLQANKAYRDQDYEKALDLFNKAIDVRRDSCVLYTNRAVTLLQLGLFTRAVSDCDFALKLNENSLKARLYKARALFEMGEEEQSQECLDELRQKFPDKLDIIDDYEKSWICED